MTFLNHWLPNGLSLTTGARAAFLFAGAGLAARVSSTDVRTVASSWLDGRARRWLARQSETMASAACAGEMVGTGRERRGTGWYGAKVGGKSNDFVGN
jgi:hypothetical protein